MEEQVQPVAQVPKTRIAVTFLVAIGLSLLQWGLRLIGFNINLYLGAVILAAAFCCVAYGFWIWEKAAKWKLWARVATIAVACMIYSVLIGRQIAAQYRLDHPTTVKPSNQPPPAQELTGFVQLAGIRILNHALKKGEPITLNIGYAVNGSQPITDFYNFQRTVIADFHKDPDEKTDRDAEEYIHKGFIEDIEKQKRVIEQQKLEARIGVGVGIAWRTLRTSPLTNEEVAGLVNGQSRLYVTSWVSWKDSRGTPATLITCNSLRPPTSADLSKQEKVWALCTWWPQ